MRWWLVLVCVTACGDKDSALSFKVTSGDAPFTTVLTGPQSLLDRASRCTKKLDFHGYFGNGLGIDWGDGSRLESVGWTDENCAAVQTTHTYMAPGTYLVSARAWHPDGNDQGVVDWNLAGSIVVTGKAAAPTLSIAPERQDPYLANQLPKAEWILHTAGRMQLSLELVAADGVVVATSKPIDVRASRSGAADLVPTPALARELLQAPAQFTLRARGTSDGAVVIAAASVAFTIHTEDSLMREENKRAAARNEANATRAAAEHELKLALRAGTLREATRSELAELHAALAKESPPRTLSTACKHPLVVLDGFAFPAGLAGKLVDCFIVPKATKLPDGDPGESPVCDWNASSLGGQSKHR